MIITRVRSFPIVSVAALSHINRRQQHVKPLRIEQFGSLYDRWASRGSGDPWVGRSNEWLIDGVRGQVRAEHVVLLRVHEHHEARWAGIHTWLGASRARSVCGLVGTPLSAGVAGIIDASSLDAQLQCLATQVRSDGTADFRAHRRSIV